MEDIKYCENCGKEIEVIYASGRFCNRSCAAAFSAKQHKNQEVIKENLAKARLLKKSKEKKKDIPCKCSFCQKECKNENSLRNHERLCKFNPNKQEISSTWIEKMKSIDRHTLIEKMRGIYTCDFCGKTWETTNFGKKLHESYCLSNPQRKEGPFQNKKHSFETKQKISQSEKRAHDEGRGHTWIHRPTNPSYAESWLYDVLESRNINFEKEKPFKGFFLDVVVGNKVIEIDGEQHYDSERFPEQQDRDNRKDDLLAKEGFKELRLRWSEVRKNPELYINKILEFLN